MNTLELLGVIIAALVAAASAIVAIWRTGNKVGALVAKMDSQGAKLDDVNGKVAKVDAKLELGFKELTALHSGHAGACDPDRAALNAETRAMKGHLADLTRRVERVEKPS